MVHSGVFYFAHGEGLNIEIGRLTREVGLSPSTRTPHFNHWFNRMKEKHNACVKWSGWAPFLSSPAKRRNILWWHLTDVRMPVWLSVIRWLSKSLTWKVRVSSAGTSSWDTGQVRVWRSSGRDQGHRFKSSGLFLATIYNQSQLAERMHVARYWSINTAATAVPLNAHPSPFYYNEISGGHIGRGVVRRRCSAGPVLPLWLMTIS